MSLRVCVHSECNMLVTARVLIAVLTNNPLSANQKAEIRQLSLWLVYVLLAGGQQLKHVL